MIFQQRLNVWDGTATHFLVDGAHNPLFDLFVKVLAKVAKGPWRGDDRKGIEVTAKHPPLELIRCVLDPAVLFLLVEVGFAKCRTGASPAAWSSPRSLQRFQAHRS